MARRLGSPTWLADVAKIFPVSHLAAALVAADNPHTTDAGIASTDLAVRVPWGVTAAVIAMRRFTWMPCGA